MKEKCQSEQVAFWHGILRADSRNQCDGQFLHVNSKRVPLDEMSDGMSEVDAFVVAG